jgi:CubicO group peptidase (beta-lactamase class C family)
MARFGLLTLNKGKWKSTSILSDMNYFTSSTNSSQELNPSYGYLWWLNGKSSFMLPGINFSFNGSIVPNAPDDMICALGKNDQKIYIVPSQNLVVVRMGEASGEIVGALSSFDNQLWGLLDQLICEVSHVSDIENEEMAIKYLNNAIENISDRSITISLINNNGIIQENFEMPPFSKIDISSIPFGVYYINYLNNKTRVRNLKIIKN